MKRLMLATLIAVAVGSSSGCCLFDRLFGCPRGYPMPGCGGCSSCGGCDSCGDCYQGGCYQGCDGCQTGDCGSPNGGGCPTCGPDGGAACDGGCQGPFRHAGYRQPVPGGPPGICNWGQRRYMGPPTGQVMYPYYTTRGPRDFLNPNPPSIGP
ncbi:MAG TPA: hypothetical protein VG713_08275 [Pirellulales bacterium]|nr:hypothetical protein [Pirellulales bacterium]